LDSFSFSRGDSLVFHRPGARVARSIGTPSIGTKTLGTNKWGPVRRGPMLCIASFPAVVSPSIHLRSASVHGRIYHISDITALVVPTMRFTNVMRVASSAAKFFVPGTIPRMIKVARS